MTTTITPDSNALWHSSWNLTTRQAVIVRDRQHAGTVSASKPVGRVDWKHTALARLRDLMASCITPPTIVTLERFIAQLNELPDLLPAPFITVGEAGTIVLEWDTSTTELHITFGDDADEVYFADSELGEWEGTLSSSPKKLISAIRSVATSA